MKQKTTQTHSSRATRGLIPLLFITFAVSTAQAQNTATTDQGVVINGITWATRNVDAPGTFAKTPESAGMFYQWNRKIGWNVTDKKVSGWDKSIPQGVEWEKVNDPCPWGWRVPTLFEINSLVEISGDIGLIITNDITVVEFTDTPTGNVLYLPIAGFRYRSDGGLLLGGTGYYWSSSQYDSKFAYCLFFGKRRSVIFHQSRAEGQLVRCVKE